MRTTRRFTALATLLLILTTAPSRRLVAQDVRGVELVTIVDVAGQEVGLYEASHALVIGVSDYTAGWKDLPGVVGDVEAVSQTLEEHGFEVRREMDLDHRDLDRVIEEFIAQKGQAENVRVLIYFAGHGYSLPHRFVGEMGYVVPSDAPRPDRDPARFSQLALPMDEIEVYAKKIQSKHALFLFDSCFSGSIFVLERTDAPPVHISAKTTEPVRQFITAGKADETVPDESIFRRQFVAALDGEADTNEDRYVTATELGEFLFEKVVHYSRERQHPQYGKIRDSRLDKGDFVFRLPAVPEAPDPEFSLDDLDRRADWARYRGKMREAFVSAESYEARTPDASLKAEAWQRFQETFGDDDPFSEEDESLRSRAAERVAHWRREVSAVLAPSSPISVPAKPQPGDARTETSLGMRFRYIPAGTFQMGSPPDEEGRDSDENLHEVTLTRGYWMGETEVTQGQWRQLMGNNPSGHQGCEDCPVEQVSWWDAVAFANRLSEEAERERCYDLVGCQGKAGEAGYSCQFASLKSYDCHGYRLPTEAEWERAARAGSSYAVDQRFIAWFLGNSGDKSHPVGGKAANAWDLRDMLGNVLEMTEDAAELNSSLQVVTATYDKSGRDPLSERGSRRVARGGGWANAARNCREADRTAAPPALRGANRGFRVVKTSG